jgi:hypothetical protein
MTPQLYGLYKTAKDGPAPPASSPTFLGKVKPRGSVVLTLSTLDLTDPQAEAESAESVAARQLSAWRECGELSSVEAMRTFIVTLFTVQPQWDYRLR